MDRDIELDDLDMELIYGDEDYEELQEYFEHRKSAYPSGSKSMSERLKNEYTPDIWEELNEEDKVSDRRQAIRGIRKLLQKVSSNESQSSTSETESEG